MRTGVERLQQLSQAIDQIEHNQIFEYLSRWSLGGMLDSVASEIQKCLAEALLAETPKEKLGCTLLYRVSGDGPDSADEPRYIIGGTSTLRTAMDPTARRYVLGAHAHRDSFTAYALRYGQPLAFDDFQEIILLLAERVKHRPKTCELPPSQQASYLAIPGPRYDFAERALQCGGSKLPQPEPLTDKELPEGLLRVTSTRTNVAGEALSLFNTEEGRCALDRVFGILKKGRSELKPPGPLAIADLNSNLLRYKDQEYEGLDALASHLQTLFSECECSMFRAPPVDDQIHLYLAATTALSDNKQHKKFRRTFFRDREHYTCIPDAQRRPDESDWAKTERV